MLNIAASTGQIGNSAMPGAGNGASGANAPEGLFSALVSLLSGTEANTDAAIGQSGNGTPTQTSQMWLNLQAGDEALSFNSQALNSAINPQDLFGQIPGLANGLQIDQQVLQQVLGQGLNGIVNTATATDTPSQIAALGNTILNIQETLQQSGLQNGTPAQQAPNSSQTTPQTSQAQLLSLMAQSDQANLNANGQNPNGQNTTTQNATREMAQTNANQLVNAQQIATQLSGNQQGLNTPLTPEQIASRDPLASDLQRQLSTSTELNQARNGIQSANATNSGPQTPLNLAAGQSQLPFVQTRQILTSGDPMTIAQAPAQGAVQSEQAPMLRPLQASYPSNPINLSNMAIEIARNFNAGVNRFQIRLDPPELGRIDIRMQIDDGGNLNARLTVERPDTLEFLQRDARALERALAQAGLDNSRTNLEFELKDNPSGGQDQNDQNPDSNPDSNDNNKQIDPVSDPTMIAAYKGNVSPAGISIWV
ncbi:MAG: flagellar hook-length control protein FliK [Devosiaceae bacterium]|nr:flagellar hook-length control protein FliK [Devosiaceae bacterium]